MTTRAALGLVVVPGVLAGCAAFTCQPVSVVVAAREERTRLESEFRGITTDHLGRVVEQRRDVLVPEYWIKDTAGAWHRVDARAWRSAMVGQPIEVCR